MYWRKWFFFLLSIAQNEYEFIECHFVCTIKSRSCNIQVLLPFTHLQYTVHTYIEQIIICKNKIESGIVISMAYLIYMPLHKKPNEDLYYCNVLRNENVTSCNVSSLLLMPSLSLINQSIFSYVQRERKTNWWILIGNGFNFCLSMHFLLLYCIIHR